MQWDQVEPRWNEYAVLARTHWSKLSDDDWAALTGTKGHLIGRIQKRYELSRAEAEKQVDDWSSTLVELAPLEITDAPLA